MADRLAVMNEGRILQVGTPDEVYEAPSCRFAAEFIGSTNLFGGVLAADSSRLFGCPDLDAPLQVQNPMNARQGLQAQLALRPERIALGYRPAGQEVNHAAGTIEQMAYLGSYMVFYVRLASGRLVAVNASRMTVRALERKPDYGDTVYLSWSAEHLTVLDK